MHILWNLDIVVVCNYYIIGLVIKHINNILNSFWVLLDFLYELLLMLNVHKYICFFFAVRLKCTAFSLCSIFIQTNHLMCSNNIESLNFLS